MNPSEDDLTIDIQLRPIDEVAHRMVILAGLIQIALTLTDPDDDRPVEQIEQELIDLADALLIGESAAYLSDRERAVLESDLSVLDEESLGEMVWSVEALDALSWALAPDRVADLAPWLPADAARLIGTIPAPWDEMQQFATDLRHRPEDEIAAARETAELWVWRGAVDVELQNVRGTDRSDLLSSIREAAEEAAEAGLITSADGDFRAERVAYARSTDETKAVIAQVSYQQLWALNWLCGFGNSWDDVPLDI